jgi:hypothetical protein
MRTNLENMLESLELHNLLGIPSGSALFTTHRRDFTHTTSALRYPVFIAGENYTGHAPHPLRHKALLHSIETMLAPELNQIPSAMIIPLGKSVSDIIEHLAQRGLLDRRRCLLGFPHPSGANGHRKKFFEANRDRMKQDLAQWFRRA